MARDNEAFGLSLGGYRTVEHDEVPIDLSITGLNYERGLKQVPDSEAAVINRVRTLQGGIAPEFSMFNFPPDDIGMFDPILHIASLEHLTQKLVVRMTYQNWEWFTGSGWVAVPGTVAGLTGQRMYSTIMDDKLIVANGATRLKSWDGSPINSVVDLSSEAPAAKYVTRIGNRLLAANLKFVLANDLNPNEVAWSADNNINEWTDVVAGAGDAIIKPEGSPSAANYITGLSNLERGTILYRQRSLVLISRTGVRAAPFRFATVDFSKGTESPYSIASGGLALGDFFLGFDYVVYHFDGQNPPVAVGMPIQRRLMATIPDLAQCVGFIDPLKMEYTLLCPREGQPPTMLPDAYIFNIRTYINDQKLSWRYRNMDPLPVSTGAHIPRVATVFVPFVDSLSSIADRVDPTDEPKLVVAVTAAYTAAPPPVDPEPPIPSEFRSSYGAFGLAVSLWGFDKDTDGNFTDPKEAAPDNNQSNTNGVSLVQRDGLLDQAKAVGARISFRVQAGNSSQMVNYPTNRTFDISKWKAGVGGWIDEVESVTGGVARLRRAVKERTWNWLYGFDDYTASGTSGNSFLHSLIFEEIEECCYYVKVTRNMPWMPIVGRGRNTYQKFIASAAGVSGSSFRNEASRINGIRQFKYFDAGWAQWSPTVDKGRGYSNPLSYFTDEVAAGLTCGCGLIAGVNIQRGLGTTPGYGCVFPGFGTVGKNCGLSPKEFADTIDAIKTFPSIYGFYIYAYNNALDYWKLPAMQDAFWDGWDYMKTRPEGILNIRGTSGKWYGDLNGGNGP